MRNLRAQVFIQPRPKPEAADLKMGFPLSARERTFAGTAIEPLRSNRSDSSVGYQDVGVLLTLLGFRLLPPAPQARLSQAARESIAIPDGARRSFRETSFSVL
jgi:hypothetical protein